LFIILEIYVVESICRAGDLVAFFGDATHVCVSLRPWRNFSLWIANLLEAQENRVLRVNII